MSAGRGWGWLAGGTLLALAGGLAASTGDAFVLRPLLWNAAPLAWWCVLAVTALGLGAAFLRALRVPPLPEGRGFTAVVAAGAGLALLSAATLLLGLAGGVTPPLLALLALLSAGAAALSLRGWWEREGRGLARTAAGEWRESPAPWAAAGAGGLFLLLLALVPTVSFDALSYHLEVPARFLEAGRVVPLPDNFASNYPLLGGMLFLLGEGLGGAALAQLLHFLFFLLTLALAWSWARRFFGREAAWWGTALLATLPPFLLDALGVGTDWPAAFFTLGAVFLASSPDRSPPRMALAGALGGFAAGAKYPGLAFALLLPAAAMAAVDLWGRRPLRPALAGWGSFLLAGAAAATPWYAKNLAFTGDPFFPLLSGAGLAGGTGFGSLLRDAHFAGPGAGGVLGLLTLPFGFVFDFPAYQMPWSPGVVLLALLPALFALRGSGKGSRFQLLWAASGVALWYATFRLGRFALPFVAVACLWLGAGLAALLAKAPPLPRRALAAGAGLALLANAGVFVAVGQSFLGNLPAALGFVTPDRYLEGAYPPFRSLRFLNGMEPPPGKVLFLGEMRAFGAAFPREVPLFASKNRLVEMARAGFPPEAMAAELGRAGFSHILMNPKELDRLSRPGAAWALPPEGEESLRAFLARRTRKAFESGGVLVLEVIRG